MASLSSKATTSALAGTLSPLASPSQSTRAIQRPHSHSNRSNNLMTDSQIEPDTIQAYRETAYGVAGDQPFDMHIDVVSEELLALHAARRVTCSAFITACNPFSRFLDAPSNQRRHDQLRLELERRELAFLEGAGEHPSNGWPEEASFLVLGISLDDASEIGRQFEQNGIVWSDAEARPQLILLR